MRHDDVSTAQWPCGGGRYALPADATASGGAIRRNEGPTTVKKILRNRTSHHGKMAKIFGVPAEQGRIFASCVEKIQWERVYCVLRPG